MPTVAGAGQAIYGNALALGAAILAAFCRRAFATGTDALLGFLFVHTHPLLFSYHRRELRTMGVGVLHRTEASLPE